MAFILAFRNLVHDKARLAATIAGLTFAVILVGVQLGLYLGVRKIITDMIDHTAAQLWIVPFGTQSIEDSFPLLGGYERHEVLATPGVERVMPLVVSFADWDRPDGGITHVVVVRIRCRRWRPRPLESSQWRLDRYKILQRRRR